MKEIKSFREYIEEQKSLKANLIVEDGVEDEFSISKLTDWPVTDIYPRYLSGEVGNQKAQINRLFNQLKATLKGLEDGNYVTTRLVLVSKKAKQDENAADGEENSTKKTNEIYLPLDLTGTETIYSIIRDWSLKWFSKVKDARETKGYLRNVEIMRSKRTSKEEKDEAYKRISAKEETENSSENLLNEFTWRTPGEISSGVGNRFNTRRLFKKASKYKTSGKDNNAFDTRNYQDYNLRNEKAKGVYNVDTKLIEKIREKYRKDAFKIIKDDIGYVRNYMNAAAKKVERYNKVGAYIKVNDKAYLDDIFSILANALSVSISIGTNLRKLNTECKNALNKVYNEMSYQDAANKEKAGEKDTSSVIDRYKEKTAKKLEKDEYIDAEKAAEAERKKQDDDYHKARVEKAAEGIKHASELIDKSIDDFYATLRQGKITLKSLEEKFKKDTLKKYDDDTKFTNLQTTYLLLSVLKNGELRKFGYGPTATPKYESELKKILDGLHSVNKDSEDNEPVGIDWEDIKEILDREFAKFSTNDQLKAKESLDKKIAERTNKEIFNDISGKNLLRLSDIENFIDINIPGTYSLEDVLPRLLAGYILLNLFKTSSGRHTLESLTSNTEPIKLSNIQKYFNEGSEEAKSLNNNLEKFKQKILREIRRLKISDIGAVKLKKELSDKKNSEKAKVAVGAAKDFKGEEPEESEEQEKSEESEEPEAKNIFDYAVQKAKRLQEK